MSSLVTRIKKDDASHQDADFCGFLKPRIHQLGYSWLLLLLKFMRGNTRKI
jgi:hypothetical protein